MVEQSRVKEVSVVAAYQCCKCFPNRMAPSSPTSIANSFDHDKAVAQSSKQVGAKETAVINAS
jgi:hypothetical protein